VDQRGAREREDAAGLDLQVLVWRGDVDGAGAGHLAVRGRLDGERGTPPQDLRQEAGVVPVEVLHHHHGSAEPARQRAEHGADGVQPPG
jgi:hypothetical protein